MSLFNRGKSSRDSLVKKMIGTGLIQRQTGTANIKGTIGADDYFQQTSIKSAQFGKIFGNEGDFLKRLDDFSEEYYKLLSNKANLARGAKVNVDLMRGIGKIDLGLLNRDMADKLYDRYSRDVLRLGDLMREAGLPGIEIPSANMYSKSFRYMVGSDALGQQSHPAALVLNRSFFSFNPRKTGLQGFKVGRSNLMSGKVVREVLEQSKNKSIFGQLQEGMNIVTLDVETTGVFERSQVRSLSAAVMTVEKGKLSAPKEVMRTKAGQQVKFGTISYDSPQLGGLRVGGKETFAEMIARQEGLKPLGSKEFLDEGAKFVENLLHADRVVAHNAAFDITKMYSTFSSIEGFKDHARLRQGLSQLSKRIDSGNFLIDTLNYSSTYISSQIDTLLEASKAVGVGDRSQRYVDDLFAQEILAKVHIGKSAAPMSMENIALNSNLFALLEKEGKAEEIFDKIARGSHVSETDVHLQSYVARYISTGELKFGPLQGATTEFQRFARLQISKSQALTPTTNIADVQHLSENVFNRLMSDENLLRKVTIVGEDDRGIGISAFQGGQAKTFYMDRTVETLNNDEQISHIRDILADARMGKPDTSITVGKTTFKSNRSASSILDLGFSYGAQSAADEMIANVNAGIKVGATRESILDAMGSVYQAYGSGLSMRDRMSTSLGVPVRDLPFDVGLGNFAANVPNQVAAKLAAAGDQFYFLDSKSRTISTILANLTSSTALEANRLGYKEGYNLQSIAFTAQPKKTAEFGLSVYRAQQEAYGFGKATFGDSISKLVVPFKVTQEALGATETMENIYFSVAKQFGGNERLNLVWDINRQLGRDESESLVAKIFGLMSDEETATKVLGTSINDSVKVEIASIEALISANQLNASQIDELKSGNAQILKLMLGEENYTSLMDDIIERGIVVGSAPNSEEIVESLGKMGVELGNDAASARFYAAVQRTGLKDDYLTLGPVAQADAVELAGVRDQLIKAQELTDIDGAMVSKQVKAVGQISEELADKGFLKQVSKKISTAKTGIPESNVVESFIKYKKNIGIGLAAASLMGFGYYRHRKNEKQEIYDETLEKQQYQRTMPKDPLSEYKQGYSYSSERYNPLATAGVVGNLDRQKIGHYQMGGNKYDHLFGR
jgi:DNA polymerase III epsilon subunit-like protein